MIKIFDCSNSPERPEHRHNSGGPKENDIILDLKKYSSQYDCEFVNDYKNCDVILTNDIFPKELQNIKIPKIKRMDGVYWDFNRERNEKLNLAATQADHVIFISKFSQNSLKTLYPEIKIQNESVILNRCDNKIFIKKNMTYDLSFAASCTNWSRHEKRFETLIRLSKMIPEKIYLIGECDFDVPNDVEKLGYFSDYNELSTALNKASAYINVSYRDAAPKCVCQALSCGLPVLYTDSGGVKELVRLNGVGIRDENKIYFDEKSHYIKDEDLLIAYKEFKNNFIKLRTQTINTTYNYQKTLKQYFNIIKQYA